MRMGERERWEVGVRREGCRAFSVRLSFVT
jgi:hypothetical protein